MRELAAADLGLAPLLARVSSGDELVARTADILLASCDREARRALGLAARVEYAHPAMTSAMADHGPLPRGPWLQHLEDGWVRVRPCWLQLSGRCWARGPGRVAIHCTRRRTGLEAGACEQAVFLYLESGDHDCAARVITSPRQRADGPRPVGDGGPLAG